MLFWDGEFKDKVFVTATCFIVYKSLHKILIACENRINSVALSSKW
jgi:hypothetical protein